MKDPQMITSGISKKFTIDVYSGHYVTTNSHTSQYMDFTRLLTRQTASAEAGNYFSFIYEHETPIDTIFCMEGTDLIGANIARRVCETGILAAQGDKDMNVLRPEYDANGNICFKDNVLAAIKGKKVLVLCASLSTGATANKAIESINYYGGWVVGIASIFSAVNMVKDIPIHSLFTPEDLPGGYTTHDRDSCPLCKDGVKIDAIVNSFGFSKL